MIGQALCTNQIPSLRVKLVGNSQKLPVGAKKRIDQTGGAVTFEASQEQSKLSSGVLWSSQMTNERAAAFRAAATCRHVAATSC